MVEVEATHEFRDWLWDLSERERRAITTAVDRLEIEGLALGHPHSSKIQGSRHGGMRELRIHHSGDPYRVFYCFDPRRHAVVLIGGNKASDKQFYERMVPIADDLYDEYLEELRSEGEI